MYDDVTAAPLKELDILVIDMYVELLVCVVLLEPRRMSKERTAANVTFVLSAFLGAYGIIICCTSRTSGA